MAILLVCSASAISLIRLLRWTISKVVEIKIDACYTNAMKNNTKLLRNNRYFWVLFGAKKSFLTNCILLVGARFASLLTTCLYKRCRCYGRHWDNLQWDVCSIRKLDSSFLYVLICLCHRRPWTWITRDNPMHHFKNRCQCKSRRTKIRKAEYLNCYLLSDGGVCHDQL